MQELLSCINGYVNELREAKGLGPIVLSAGSQLLNGEAEIDSLDLAALLVHLESCTGTDPFASGFINFSSVGELMQLYANGSKG